MFTLEPKLAPTPLLVRYLSVFQRFFPAVINYTQNGDKAGMLLGGYLADALHNVPGMLWHCDDQGWFNPKEMEVWMEEFPQGLEERGAPQRLVDDSRRILSTLDAAKELQLREDLADLNRAPLLNLHVYLDWLYRACLYIRTIQVVSRRQLAVWRDLEEAWSADKEEAERMANFNTVLASVLLSVPSALVHWNQFDEEQFHRVAIGAAERLPVEDREAWIRYVHAKAEPLSLLPT